MSLRSFLLGGSLAALLLGLSASSAEAQYINQFNPGQNGSSYEFGYQSGFNRGYLRGYNQGYTASTNYWSHHPHHTHPGFGPRPRSDFNQGFLTGMRDGIQAGYQDGLGLGLRWVLISVAWKVNENTPR